MPTAPDAVLATASSVEGARFNALEAGPRRPAVITLVRIGRALDTTAAALMTGIA